MKKNGKNGSLESNLLRPDLRAVGLVLVRPDRQGTDTLWCEPDVHPAPLFEAAAEAGREPAALLLVFDHEVNAFVNDYWKRTRWVTRYVESVARGIKDAGGLEGYLGPMLERGGLVVSQQQQN